MSTENIESTGQAKEEALYLRMPWYLVIPHLTRKACMRYFLGKMR